MAPPARLAAALLAALGALALLASPARAAGEDGKSRMQLIAPDLDAPAPPAVPKAKPKPAAKQPAAVSAPRLLDNGALAIAAVWLETEIRQDAVEAALKYQGKVLQVEGLLKEKALAEDVLLLTLSSDPKKKELLGIRCQIKDAASKHAGGSIRIGQKLTFAGKLTKVADATTSTDALLTDCIVLTGHADAAAAAAQIAALSGAAAAAPAAPEGEAGPAGAPEERAGTAYFVSADGYLLTSFEAVKGCRSITAHSPGGEEPLVVVKIDQTNDLVLLKAPAAAPAVARFRSGPGVAFGATLSLAGRPATDGGDAALDLTTGIVSGLSGTDNDTRLLRVTTPARRGAGGAPLLDEQGAVVGQLLLASKAGEAAQAPDADPGVPANGHLVIVAELIRRFLEVNEIRYETATAPATTPSSTTPSSTTPLAERARGFTLPFVCTPAAAAKQGG